MATFLSRIRALRYWIDRRRLEAELTEEIEDHRARRQAALERAGLSPAEAAAASRLWNLWNLWNPWNSLNP